MTLSLQSLHSKVKRKKVKIVGRGNASGHGTFSTRGIKGQHARAGSSHKPGFEGGRTTIIMQTPKSRGKGFRSYSPEFEVVTLEELNVFKDKDIVNRKSLRLHGLTDDRPAKIVAGGNLSRALDVRVPATQSAASAIVKAGGKVAQPETSLISKTE